MTSQVPNQHSRSRYFLFLGHHGVKFQLFIDSGSRARMNSSSSRDRAFLDSHQDRVNKFSLLTYYMTMQILILHESRHSDPLIPT